MSQTPEKAAYIELLRRSSMSLGVYRIPAGGTDPQSPHNEDEAYYVVSGQAQITVGEETIFVGPGTLVFVERQMPHWFHDVVEDLAVLVFFAPAES